MKPQGIIGVILILVAACTLYFGGFSFTHKEQVFKAGPLEVNANKTDRVAVPAIIGWVGMVGGVALAATGWRK